MAVHERPVLLDVRRGGQDPVSQIGRGVRVRAAEDEEAHLLGDLPDLFLPVEAREVVPEDLTVALSPIGAFGWYSELKIVDVLGLTNTSAAQREPDLSIALKGHHRSDGAWVLSQEPDYVILGNGVRDQAGRLVVNPWERDLVNDKRFPQEYLRESVPIPGGADLDLYRRRSAPPLPGAQSAR